MNWYKKISSVRRIAMPITERNKPTHYIDIGHGRNRNGAGLWLIDKNWNMKVDQEALNHSNVFTEDEMDNGMAYGRFMQKENGEKVVSVYWSHFILREKSPREQEFIKKRVEKMLDQTFDNPAIYDYE